MAARTCAFPNCGAGKNHPVHGRHHPSHHPFMDARTPGLKPMSEGMRAYREQSGYNAAARQARGNPCQIVSPVCTGQAEALHEPLTRGRAGGLRAAVEAGGTVESCNACNGYVSENPVWGREHGWIFSATVEGRAAASEAKAAREQKEGPPAPTSATPRRRSRLSES